MTTSEHNGSAGFLDLRTASLADFRDFVFEGLGQDGWSWEASREVTQYGKRVVDLQIELFRTAGALIDLYAPKTLKRGLQELTLGSGWGTYDLVWNDGIAIEARELLIRSMYDLYSELFTIEPLDTVCFMWWDPLAYDFNPMQRADPVRNPDHRRIRDVMFETLVDILRIECLECQMGAVHGLNHVNHPDTEQVITAYLRQHPDLPEEERKIALACSRGEMM